MGDETQLEEARLDYSKTVITIGIGVIAILASAGLIGGANFQANYAKVASSIGLLMTSLFFSFMFSLLSLYLARFKADAFNFNIKRWTVKCDIKSWIDALGFISFIMLIIVFASLVIIIGILNTGISINPQPASLITNATSFNQTQPSINSSF